MVDSNRTSWNNNTEVWEPIPEEQFGEAVEFRGRELITDAPEDEEVYIWSASQMKWILGKPAVTVHASVHEDGGADEISHDNLDGAGSNSHAELDSHVVATASVHGFDALGNAPPQDHDNSSHSITYATDSDLDDHVIDEANPHVVTAAQADAEPSGTVATHSVISTGVHGVGASTVESTSGAASKVTAHSDDTTGVHGVIGHAVASVGDIEEHENYTTNVHGVGGSTIASAADITTHGAVTTGVHGVGTSTVASVSGVSSSIATHAAVVNSHGVEQKTKSSDQSSTSTSFANINDLSASVSSNTTYQIDAVIMFTTDATTTGIDLGVNGPSGATVVGTATAFIADGSQDAKSFNTFNETGNEFSGSLSGNNVAIMTVLLDVSTTSGTFYLRFACEGQSQTVTAKAGSTMRIREV